MEISRLAAPSSHLLRQSRGIVLCWKRSPCFHLSTPIAYGCASHLRSSACNIRSHATARCTAPTPSKTSSATSPPATSSTPIWRRAKTCPSGFPSRRSSALRRPMPCLRRMPIRRLQAHPRHPLSRPSRSPLGSCSALLDSHLRTLRRCLGFRAGAWVKNVQPDAKAMMYFIIFAVLWLLNLGSSAGSIGIAMHGGAPAPFSDGRSHLAGKLWSS